MYNEREYIRLEEMVAEGIEYRQKAAQGESNRPWLADSGYRIEGGMWRKSVSFKARRARRDHNGIKAGNRYNERIERLIDDETGKSRHERTLYNLGK